MAEVTAVSNMKVKVMNLNIAFSDFIFVVLQYLNKILQNQQSKALTFKYRVSILYCCFHHRYMKIKTMKSFTHITNCNHYWI